MFPNKYCYETFNKYFQKVFGKNDVNMNSKENEIIIEDDSVGIIAPVYAGNAPDKGQFHNQSLWEFLFYYFIPPCKINRI